MFQINKLNCVLESPCAVHSCNADYPTIHVHPSRFLILLKYRLQQTGIKVYSVELTGGCASYVLSKSEKTSYNDIDITFVVDINKIEHHVYWFNQIRKCLLRCVIEGYKSLTGKDISQERTTLAYVQKMMKIPKNEANGQSSRFSKVDDFWSLITLRNNHGQNMEFKFLLKMKTCV
eukprot:UN29073